MLIWFVYQIMNYKIDNLQYCNWSRKIFEINREAGLDAVHATIVYHEDFNELLLEVKKWDKLFKQNYIKYTFFCFLKKRLGYFQHQKQRNKMVT